MDKGYVSSCHDCSEGGILVSITEMSIGGGKGCICDIDKLRKSLRSDQFLFSETNSRWIIEVKKEKSSEFEDLLTDAKVPCFYLGIIEGDHVRIMEKNKCLIDQSVSDLDTIWRHAISNVMGG